MKDAKNQGAMWGPNGELTTHTSYGGGERFTAMCPASKLWRDEMLSWTRELGISLNYIATELNRARDARIESGL